MNDSQPSLEEFAELFFMPVKTATPAETMLRYKVQVPVIRKDFYPRIKDLPSVVGKNWVTKMRDDSTFLIENEEEMVSGQTTSEGGLVMPSQEVIKAMMDRVFNLRRNKDSHAQNRKFVGGYIIQKLIRSGLMVASQDFDHDIPIGDLARLKKVPYHVVSCHHYVLRSKNP